MGEGWGDVCESIFSSLTKDPTSDILLMGGRLDGWIICLTIFLGAFSPRDLRVAELEKYENCGDYMPIIGAPQICF